MRIFPKPDLIPEKRKENLEYEINLLQIKYEKLTTELETEYQKRRKERIEMLDELDWNGFCKQKEDFAIRMADLLKRESTIDKKETEADNKLKEINILVGEMLRGALRKQKLDS